MSNTSIAWSEKVWNCLRGCTRVSPGCEKCYAERIAYRFSGEAQPYHGLVRLGRKGPVWTGVVKQVADKLGEPLSWKKPCRVFVNSMSDVFHEGVDNDFIAAMYGVMFASQHKFQILTKRHVRMLEWHRWLFGQAGVEDAKSFGAALRIREFCYAKAMRAGVNFGSRTRQGFVEGLWPQNLWLGVSVESQRYLQERVPVLLDDALSMYKVRWISMEPQLEEVDLHDFVSGNSIEDATDANKEIGSVENVMGLAQVRARKPKLDWVVVGGESGHGARSFDVQWAEKTVDQCLRYRVPVFVKQVGTNTRRRGFAFRKNDYKGENPSEWPEEINVREYPQET